MNSTTILWRAHRALWLAVASAPAFAFAACGNQSVNVLAPRDAAEEAAPDTSLDMGPNDVPLDTGSDLTLDTGPPSDLALDTGPSDLSLDTGPNDARDAPADMPGSGDGPTRCLPVGVECNFAGACCSLACPLGDERRACASGPLCALSGERCRSNIDCCADRCEGGVCMGVSIDKCRPAGELCSSATECCGGRCSPFDGGALRCKLLDQCRVLGEVCLTTSDCCSGRCEIDERGGKLCSAAPECDLGGGRTCRGQAGDRCTTDADCCGGGCSAGWEGVLRCAAASCGGPCALCAQDRDCCTGRCLEDETGYRHCATMPGL